MNRTPPTLALTSTEYLNFTHPGREIFSWALRCVWLKKNRSYPLYVCVPWKVKLTCQSNGIIQASRQCTARQHKHGLKSIEPFMIHRGSDVPFQICVTYKTRMSMALCSWMPFHVPIRIIFDSYYADRAGMRCSRPHRDGVMASGAQRSHEWQFAFVSSTSVIIQVLTRIYSWEYDR